MSEALLQLVSIDKNYGHDHTMLPVLSDVNLSLHAGEMVALMAPSGSGKSTLLHVAGLLDQPSKGDVVINGHSTQHLSAVQQAHLRAQYLG
ncbi:MAG: ATP-binding cassette domain-containing protein, partial [Alphaproteobacteria bacterium]|nr:ATP-binding cassette domain-containing protein [Alphaproteobacteria bacterium]